MKKLFFFLFIFWISIINVKAIDTSAASAILMDMDSGRVLYAEDIHTKRLVASISKIMTAIVAIEKKDVKEKVTIGDEIKQAYGSGIYIQEGEILTLEDLLYGLMLRSGNDAAIAIAKYVGGDVDTFVSWMNAKASTLGMRQSTFHNPSGLDNEEGNYASAYDMALLMQYAYQNKTFRKIIGTKSYQLTTNKNTYVWKNKHKLLTQYPYTTGGKTGFTEKARRTLVTTASKNNLNLVVVTLNDGNDWVDHQNLFDYGFSNYKQYRLLKKGEVHIYDEIYYADYILYLKKNFSYPLTEEEAKHTFIKYELEKKRIIEENQVVGKAKVFLYDEQIGEVDVYVKEKESEKEKSNFQKLLEWFQKLW